MSSLLRDRRLARELVACHAKILGAAGALRITGHRDRSPSSLERYHPVDLGQFFIDKETLSSTYPDFGSICGDLFCGNTCCVPTDEWDVTYEKMKKWTNESRIPQWVLDKAVAAAGD